MRATSESRTTSPFEPVFSTTSPTSCRNIEEGRTPLEAAHQAMTEVSGPIVAIALVLCAVFVPMAFLTGITGQFYKQFAVTIAISTVISAINSLTLSPALAAKLLHTPGDQKDWLARGTGARV